MKKLLLLTAFTWLCVYLSSNVNAQGVGVNSSGNAPDPSAIFDASSHTKGVLISRMTTTERNAITSPAQGLLIYNTDCNTINFWNGGAWIAFGNTTNISPPGTITGNSAPCPNASGVSYSISAVTNATSYNWTVPTGASIVSGQGTTSITANFATTTGALCVTASNACGTSSPNCLTISFSSAPIAPTATTHTPSSTQIVWNWSAVSGATAYKWSTMNDFSTATDNGGSTSYTQTGLTCNTAYTSYIWAYNGCGNSSSTTLTQTTSVCCTGTFISSFGTGGAATENPSANNDVIQAIAVNGTGVYLAGYDRVPTNSEWRIEKWNLSSGAVIWTQNENPSSSDDVIRAITLDASGMYLAGYDFSPGDGEWRIEKRDFASGALISAFGTGGIITDNPTAGTDYIKAITLDAGGVYVAGTDGTGGGEWRVQKRNLTSGAVIWTQSENPSSGDDQIYAIIPDASGVYMAGFDRTQSTNNAWRIEKRDLSSGAVMWTQTENPSSGDDVVYAIALDPTGVYVAGFDAAPGNNEWRIEKRDLSTGAVLWTQTENPTSGEDAVSSLSIDGNGLYVGGYYFISGSDYAWMIEKRDLSTGAIIWTQSENPSSGEDIVQSVALDASGIYVAGYDYLPATNTGWRIEKRCK